MNRFTLKLKAFILFMSLWLCVNLQAQDFWRDGIRYEIWDDNQVAIIGSDYDEDPNLVIPETVTDDEENECTVKWIADEAFAGNESIVSITLPSTIEEIMYRAFAEMPNLTKIICPWDEPIWFDYSGVFDGTPSNVELWMPTSRLIYLENGWNEFKSYRIIDNGLSQTISIEGTGEVTDEWQRLSNGSVIDVLEGDELVLYISPEQYYTAQITVDGEDASEYLEGETFTLSDITEAHAIAISFVPDPNYVSHSVVYSYNPEEGEMRINGYRRTTRQYMYLKTDDLNIVFTPRNYNLPHLKVDGVDVTSELENNSYTITADGESHTINGWFERDENILENYMYIDGEGSVLVNGNSVNGRFYSQKGDDLVLTLQPNEFYQLAYLEVNGDEVTDQVVNNQYTIDDVDEELNIAAYFEELPNYELEIGIDGERGYYVINDEAYDYDESFRVIAGTKKVVSFASYYDDYVPYVYYSEGDGHDYEYYASQLSYDAETGLYSIEVGCDEGCGMWIDFIENISHLYADVDNDGVEIYMNEEAVDQIEIEGGNDVVVEITIPDGYALAKLTYDDKNVTNEVVDGRYTIHQIDAGDHYIQVYTVRESITFANRYMTFCSNATIELATDDPVKAWVVSGFDGTSALLTRVYVVPAQTGVLLEAEEGTEYTFTFTSKNIAYGNMLYGVINNTQLPSTEYKYYGNTYVQGRNYILANGSNGIGFYPVVNNTTLAGGKAYLWVPQFVVDAMSNVKAFSLHFDEETGIDKVASRQQKNVQIYTLDGRRAERATKGLYIINGKKVVVQ